MAFHAERRSSISIGFDGSSIIRFQHGTFIGSSGNGVHCALPISRIQDRIGTIGSIRPNGIDQLRFAKHHWCSSVCNVGMGVVLWRVASSRSHVVGIGRLYRASDCLQSLVEVLPIWSVGMAMAFTDLFEQATFPEKITQRNVLKKWVCILAHPLSLANSTNKCLKASSTNNEYQTVSLRCYYTYQVHRV